MNIFIDLDYIKMGSWINFYHFMQHNNFDKVAYAMDFTITGYILGFNKHF